MKLNDIFFYFCPTKKIVNTEIEKWEEQKNQGE